MEASTFCLITSFVLYWKLFHTATEVDHECKQCEQSRMSHHDAGIKNRAMKSAHIFRSLTATKVYDCHVKCFEENCRCQAFQMAKDRCELLYEDRFGAPEHYQHKDGYVYFDMNREYVQQVPKEKRCLVGSCNNQCCSPNPCLNGGHCTEKCDDSKSKFICTCRAEYYGRICSRMVKSCKEIFTRTQGKSVSGVYHLEDSTQQVYETFCDFTTEDGFVWTLTESFNFSNNEEFKDKPFFKSFPVNERALNWNRYRLSSSRMNQTADHSTHFRATCNFDSDKLSYDDNLRGKLGTNSVLWKEVNACVLHEVINVGNHRCDNCTELFVQTRDCHAHIINSYNDEPRARGCEEPRRDPLLGEDYFGCYKVINTDNRCTSRDNATTQWWLGEKR